MLVFLNGHNNLDEFGAMDINEMEKAGPPGNVNVVVQWASLAGGKTKRLLVRKDESPETVTSPVLEEMAPVDMGDYRKLVDFVAWGHRQFPARRYFVVVWNHGAGWHQIADLPAVRDISFDDLTGNRITTPQLGLALREASRIIGKKIDIYGSDACLMGMAEVAREVADSVEVFVGAQEVEPAEGWPYDGFFAAWAREPQAPPTRVGSLLADEFFKSYSGGSQGQREVTLSVYDLARLEGLMGAVTSFRAELSRHDAGEVLRAVKDSQSFAYSDYVDLVDFAEKAAGRLQGRIGSEHLKSIRGAVREFVTANVVSRRYARAHGVSIWLPATQWQYKGFADLYRELRFTAETGWGLLLETFFKGR